MSPWVLLFRTPIEGTLKEESEYDLEVEAPSFTRENFKRIVQLIGFFSTKPYSTNLPN
jgi:hypothetical protein